MQGLFVCILAALWCLAIPNSHAYQIPELSFEKLSNGFRISIPDEKEIVRVAFNVNRNRPFTTFEQGDFSEQIRSATDGKYVYEVHRELDDNDVIYVWISVQFNNLIYRKIAEPISIRDGSFNNTIIGSTNNDEKPQVIKDNEENNTQKSTADDSCELPLTKVTRNGQKYTPRCRGEQIFNEEFSGRTLNSNVWTAEVRLSTDTCEDEFVLYNTSNIYVGNDHLTLKASLWNDNQPGTEIRQGLLDLGNKCTETVQDYCRRRPHGAIVMPPVISARMHTKSSFSFQYGRIVARVKFPQGDWLYPLLLLEPVLVLLNDPLPCLHARIAFNRGNEHLTNARIPNTEDIGAHRLSAGIILTAFENNRNQFTVNKTSWQSFSADFHVYEVLWNEQSFIFKVDQQEYGRIRIADLTTNDGSVSQNVRQVNNLLDREFALTLGLAAGGHADFPDRGFTKPWTNTAPKAALNFWQKRNTWLESWTDPSMQVDYIHETGISAVLYAVEKNEQCPAVFDYINAPQHRLWSMTSHSDSLKNGDRLAVSVMVQNGNELYNRNEQLEVGESGLVSSVYPELVSNKIASYDQCEELQRSCVKSVTEMSGAPMCRDELIFEEDFNGATTLNPSHWSYDISLRVNGDGDEEFVMFENNSATTYIKDGVLYMKPKPTGGIQRGFIDLGTKCTSNGEECAIKADGARTFLPPVTSAQISTKNLFQFKYGRVEIRAKFPKGDWIFPKIMLRAADDIAPRIRIACALGNSRLMYGQNLQEQIGGELLTGGIIVWQPVINANGREVKQATLTTRSHNNAKHYGDEFHTYTVIWNKTSLTFGVDDIHYGTINEQLENYYYILLGVSVGGHYFFPDGSMNSQHTIVKPWRNGDHKAIYNFWKNRRVWLPTWQEDNALQVDYIRVFAI